MHELLWDIPAGTLFFNAGNDREIVRETVERLRDPSVCLSPSVIWAIGAQSCEPLIALRGLDEGGDGSTNYLAATDRLGITLGLHPLEFPDECRNRPELYEGLSRVFGDEITGLSDYELQSSPAPKAEAV